MRAYWVVLVLFMVFEASATQRLALVIGNGAYADAPLDNPTHDAALVRAALESVDFKVTFARDADLKGMESAVESFVGKLKSAGNDAVGFFYFSGHGIQTETQQNYLLPIGHRVDGPADLRREAIEADWVMEKMNEAGSGLHMMVLDACRNNPLKTGTKGKTKGLARPGSVPQGSLVAFATAPGMVAYDGDGKNSPYASALAHYLRQPGLEAREVFRRVGQAVSEATQNKTYPQRPSVVDASYTEFYFNPVSGGVAGAATVVSWQYDANAPLHVSGGGASWRHPLTIGGFAALLLGLLLIPFTQLHRNHAQALEDFARNGQAEEGLAYLDRMFYFGLPLPAGWKNLRERWRQQQDGAVRLVEQAKQAHLAGQVDQAAEHIDDALRLNPLHSEARRLRQALPSWRSAANELRNARARVVADPVRALRGLHKARQLDPTVKGAVMEAEQQAAELVRSRLWPQRIAEAEKALGQSQAYAALAAVDEALSAQAALGDQTHAATLQRLRHKAIALVEPIRGRAIGVGSLDGLNMYMQDSVELGRRSDSTPADIPVGYRRVSRAGKQCRVLWRGGSFHVEDQHSANGTWLGGQLLAPGETVVVQAASSLAVGGNRDDNRAGICQLSLWQGATEQGALWMHIPSAAVELLDTSDLGQSWPTLDADLGQRWLLLHGKAALGIKDGKWDFGCQLGSEPALYLQSEEGAIWISPAQDADEKALVEGAALNGAVPLAGGAVVQVGGLRFALRGVSA